MSRQASAATFDIASGSSLPKSQTLGPEPDPMQAHNEAPASVCTLRAGFVGTPPAEAISITLSLPHSQLELAGLDLPLVLEVEMPVRLTVVPATALSSAARVCAAVTHRRCDERWGATSTVRIVAPQGIAAVPWWVRAATLLDRAAVGEWLDAAGNVLATFSPEFPRPRPRLATQLRASAASPVVFHLST